MDFKGMALSETLFYYIIIISGAVGWIIGFLHQNFLETFYVWSLGLGISIVLCVPDWPFFNRNPVKWLDKSVLEKGVGKGKVKG
mmetsp:Transcript_10656/g.19294  ORF Transcript_10656/g.19294 Transcript_10656/m.19294 type:complete len:84 (+) Transcript_10656:1-252(+)